MAQFTVVYNNGGRLWVTAADKYEAIEKARKDSGNTTGIKEVLDANGKKC